MQEPKWLDELPERALEGGIKLLNGLAKIHDHCSILDSRAFRQRQKR
jgi:hypothetical protein